MLTLCFSESSVSTVPVHGFPSNKGAKRQHSLSQNSSTPKTTQNTSSSVNISKESIIYNTYAVSPSIVSRTTNGYQSTKESPSSTISQNPIKFPSFVPVDDSESSGRCRFLF